MNLLKNIFEAYTAHDFRLLDSYLSKILHNFIQNFSTDPVFFPKFETYFELFQPSKMITIKKDVDFFDMVYQSDDDEKKNDPIFLEGETKLSLSRDLSPLKLNEIEPNKANLETCDDLVLKPEWVRALSKIFSILDSKGIKKLLLLLEHPKETTRKMIMVLFQVLLQKTESKVHFVEKCAIGFTSGLYLISRMKYVYARVQNGVLIFQLLRKIKKYFKTTCSKLEIMNETMRGLFENSLFLYPYSSLLYLIIEISPIDKRLVLH